ncbi:hypothetical protein B0T16DRAFT_457384 [Cercophora newfieldiana]|uniref:Uncharacterized protein n=1 Tax=Cercophora newfieldiana TaxID=92897 RepID=A0AA40CUX8_9PEZI|nr:hypothetical protein B0T16DRAFT_457384 [Cercophora newfieldiana]
MDLVELLKPLEVKHDRDQFKGFDTTRWGNKDIYPVIREHRTYNICSTIGIGLTAGEACGGVLVGSFSAALLGFLAGQCGRIHNLGFMMMSRAAFGLWGSYFSIMLCVFESVVFNGIGQGMDIASFIPRYFNIRRGAILAQVFLLVLNSFGVFIAPMTGTDYWIVRRQNLVVPDLYSLSGVYWFTAGIKWRAMLSFCLAFGPPCRASSPPSPWTLSLRDGISYYAICKFFPMPRARDNVLATEEEYPEDVIEGSELPAAETANSMTSKEKEALEV